MIHPPKDGLDERCLSNLPLLLDADTSQGEIPWIDFLSTGLSIHSGKKFGWIAVVTSHPKLLELATSNRSKPKNRLWNKFYSKRALNVEIVLTIVQNEAINSSQTLHCELPNDIKSIGTCVENTSSESNANHSDFTKQVFTWVIGNDKSGQQDAPSISNRHFDCFDELLASIFGPIRYYYGSGWFGNVKNFVQSLQSLSISGSSREIFTDHTFSASQSRLLAQIGAGRLVEFGWLPPNWNLLNRLSDPESDIDKYSIRRLKHLDEQGIRVFRLPSLRFIDETYIALENSQFMKSRQQLFFASKFPADRALLAIEYKKYGKRGDTKEEISKSWDDGKIFLFRFSIGIVNILRGFFSKTENVVIAYSKASSTTTRSAVLDRLISLYRLTPNDRELEKSIKLETKNLIHSSIPRPVLRTLDSRLLGRDAYFETCLELDKQIYSAAGKGVSPHWIPIASRGLSTSNPFTEIIDQAESENPSIERGRIAGLTAGAELLTFGNDDKKFLTDSLFAEKSKRKANAIYAHMRKSVSANRECIENLDISSASRSRPLTLFFNIAKFMRRVVQRTLFVPIGLQEWVQQRIRLIWYLPLDSMNTLDTCIQSSRTNQTASPQDQGRIIPGHKLSTLVYPWLFTADANNDSIEVDISRFFDFTVDLQIDQSNESNSWLKNKIFETQYLLDGLDKKIGYCCDFEIIGLLIGGTREKKSARCLELLSTQTILKCIVMHQGGDNMLNKWREDLLNRCYEYLSAYREQNASNENVDMPPVEVFIDTMGLAAAAIDCCRNNIVRRSSDERPSLKVYMMPGRITKHFRSQQQSSSPGAINYDDGRTYERIDGLDETEISNIEILLAKLFSESPFDLDKAVDLLILWHTNEGAIRGETVEDLFTDFGYALDDIAGAYAGYKANKTALLNAFFASQAP